MMGGAGAAAHKGSPHKAAEMLSMQQSPTAEKVSWLFSEKRYYYRTTSRGY
jgi:hypothetical protein